MAKQVRPVTYIFPSPWAWRRGTVRILNASRKHLILCVSLVPSPQNPDDDNLKQMQAKLQKRLEKAQLLEDARKEFDDQPVKYSIEFLALSAAEIRKFMDYFEKIDTNRSGSITSDELFAFIGERKTQFTDSIFKMLDSLNSDEKLDFGEFMKAIGTFCFFGKEEILRFTYSVFDLDGSGWVMKGAPSFAVKTADVYLVGTVIHPGSSHTTSYSSCSQTCTPRPTAIALCARCGKSTLTKTGGCRSRNSNSSASRFRTYSSPRFDCRTRCAKHSLV